MNWSVLPLDVFLQMFRYKAMDFLFLLAVSGVCRAWRSHAAWIGTLIVRWPPREDHPEYDSEGTLIKPERRRICGKHGLDLSHCSCLYDSISAVIARHHKIWYVDLCCTDLVYDRKSLEVAKIRDEDWTKLANSLLHLEVSAGAVDARTLDRILDCHSLRELRIVCFGDEVEFPVLTEDGEVASSSSVLGELSRLDIVTSTFQEEGLTKFLARFPDVEEVEIKACSMKSDWDFLFQAPPNLHNYDLKLTAYCEFKRVRATGARRIEIHGGQFVLLENAEALEELTALPVYITFAKPEKMVNFWRLTLTGSFWEVHEAISACKTVPTTKRICLADDFGGSFLRNMHRDKSDDDSVECYDLFANLLRESSLEELELSYGFLRRMRVTDQAEELTELLPKMPKIEVLVLDLQVRPTKELDVSRLGDVVESLIDSCKTEWITLSFVDKDDEEDEANWHKECFNKEKFISAVQNVIRYGTSEPQQNAAVQEATSE